ncbi:F0F1 ATP synthase subunit B' [Pelagovum pacificum]|uniref:ATP synthase subunit b n=1 Tax=Pelagovum pacificum TaxID=2588711 RepID=A0A5C5GFA4_9RHOB|nr:F0F1 ATP synthase subunit B' [Pelagovum pacificum]QQA43445.1 F0F1 ATP synthase subunit B' [Pelagovum pacificum]TNY33418.1 F0F1 ATP synthase subunit B' [Pelagovum pacificum]
MAIQTYALEGIRQGFFLKPLLAQAEGEAEEAAEHGAEAAGHGAEAAHTVAQDVEAGMPQLDFSTFPNQIFWLIVTLLVIYFILSRVALPRIGAVLAERSGTITNDLAAAEELKLKAQEAETAYEKSLADARSEANRIAEETRASIQEELDAEIEKADKEISARTAESEKAIAEIRDGAMESVREVATDTAKAIVAAMGTTADDAMVEEAVNSRVKG